MFLNLLMMSVSRNYEILNKVGTLLYQNYERLWMNVAMDFFVGSWAQLKIQVIREGLLKLFWIIQPISASRIVLATSGIRLVEVIW